MSSDLFVFCQPEGILWQPSNLVESGGLRESKAPAGAATVEGQAEGFLATLIGLGAGLRPPCGDESGPDVAPVGVEARSPTLIGDDPNNRGEFQPDQTDDLCPPSTDEGLPLVMVTAPPVGKPTAGAEGVSPGNLRTPVAVATTSGGDCRIGAETMAPGDESVPLAATAVAPGGGGGNTSGGELRFPNSAETSEFTALSVQGEYAGPSVRATDDNPEFEKRLPLHAENGRALPSEGRTPLAGDTRSAHVSGSPGIGHDGGTDTVARDIPVSGAGSRPSETGPQGVATVAGAESAEVFAGPEEACGTVATGRAKAVPEGASGVQEREHLPPDAAPRNKLELSRPAEIAGERQEPPAKAPRDSKAILAPGREPVAVASKEQGAVGPKPQPALGFRVATDTALDRAVPMGPGLKPLINARGTKAETLQTAQPTDPAVAGSGKAHPDSILREAPQPRANPAPDPSASLKPAGAEVSSLTTAAPEEAATQNIKTTTAVVGDGTASLADRSAGINSTSATSPGTETQGMQKASDADVMRQIVHQTGGAFKHGLREVNMEVQPQSLGRIRLQISTEHQQVMVKVMTETPMVKEIIENNLMQLKSDLQAYDLEIDRFEVSVDPDARQRDRGRQSTARLRPAPDADQSADNEGSEDTRPEASSARMASGNGNGQIDYFA